MAIVKGPLCTYRIQGVQWVVSILLIVSETGEMYNTDTR